MSGPSTERFLHQVNFWLASTLEIFDFCASLTERFHLPRFVHDYENDNEWCVSKAPEVFVQVSHAYDAGTYHKWDPACPEGCNYSVLLRFPDTGREDTTRDSIEKTVVPAWVSALEALADGDVHRAERGAKS